MLTIDPKYVPPLVFSSHIDFVYLFIPRSQYLFSSADAYASYVLQFICFFVFAFCFFAVCFLFVFFCHKLLKLITCLTFFFFPLSLSLPICSKRITIAQVKSHVWWMSQAIPSHLPTLTPLDLHVCAMTLFFSLHSISLYFTLFITLFITLFFCSL